MPSIDWRRAGFGARICLHACLTVSLLTACGGGGGGDGSGDPSTPTTVPVEQTRPGGQYTETLEVEATGEEIAIAMTVFEPAMLERGGRYPLVLHSHGYGGERSTSPTDFQQRLIDAGYYVLSFDQRGFGESTGTVRVQSPDFEGADLVAVLDRAERLPGLARRPNGEMLVGSYGGSYGGMYQLLMAAVDPERRLRVIAPDITPHDLVYSLNQGDVIKSGWALALVAGGELPLIGLATGSAGPQALLDAALTALENPQRPLRQDPVIQETLLRGALTNNFPEPGRNLFAYHSFDYFCGDEPAKAQAFSIGTPDPRNVPPTDPPEIDALITQGFRDTLFNFNEALNNYRCLQKAGGDVRLLTHQSGHILPVSPAAAGLEETLEPFSQALTVPGFQDPGGTPACGGLNLAEVRFAWFQEKLQGVDGALEAALPIGREICLSLGEGDAVTVDEVTVGGTTFELDTNTQALSGVLGIVGSLLGSAPREQLLADQAVYETPAGGRVLAGVPTLDIEVSPLLGQPAEITDECLIDVLPLACDPIFFIGLARRPAGQARWDLIDDQLTPVRGFGPHSVNMVGVGERLFEGDEVGMVIYGFHLQYPITWSRDLLAPAARISGQVSLPLLEDADLAREGI